MIKSKYIIIGILIVLVVGIIAAIMFVQQGTDLKTKCCTECKNAFSESPIGVGPEMAKCGKFSTAQPLSEKCKAYFQNNPMTVSECR